MFGKIQALQGEVCRLSQSLESSLLEKGEIASRLNSTQEETRGRKKMGEMLKAAQRKSDSLQDRIAVLEREKEDQEESLEEAVLQAETATAELEEERIKVEEEKRELTEKLSELSATLDDLRSEKGQMERELETKNREIEELKSAKEQLERGLEKAQLEASQQRETSLEQRGAETEGERERLQSLLVEMEKEKSCLHTSLEEWEKESNNLRNSIKALEEEIKELQTQIKEGRNAGNGERRAEQKNASVKSIQEEVLSTLSSVEQERDHLQCTLASVEGEKERLEQERGVLAEEKEKLQADLSLIEKETQQTLSSLKDRTEQEKLKIDGEKQELQSSLSSIEVEKNNLSSALSSLEQEKETLAGEQETLQSTVASMEKELEESKESAAKLNEQVSQLTSQAARLSKERDSARGKMSLLMKTCKQLEQEKQEMLNGSGDVKSSDAVQTEAKQLKRRRQSRERRSGRPEECSAAEEVHKLEETNDSLTIRLEQLTASRPANESNVPSSSADAARRRRSGRKSYSKHPEEKLDENTENMAPLTLQRSPQGKRAHRDISNKDKRPGGPAQPDKEDQANAVTTAKPKTEQEDDEFRPEGLPELVQRGFGDIPLGEASPFIMRRTTVKRCSPRLAAEQTVLGSMPCLSPNGEEKSAHRSLSVHQTPEKQEDNCHVQ
ncbi:hypothetical protein KUCAC02_001726 [Chaenocephalus aceratus]|uniref:Uncharacterized protein n=1 Tax=Chaenocephalus aceratus TaxID=36190 RepID=A0ACB9XSV5_CHAAC|nr:hypothetical protein KUCAC02_001726 [Chaenocephalus aceratus]